MPVLQSTSADSGIEITTDASHADLVDAVSHLAQQVEDLTEQVETLEEENQELREALEATRGDLQDTRDHGAALAKDIAETKGRVSELEDAGAETSDLEAGASTDVKRLHETLETPLETVVAWSEESADDELTANQQRARFVACDVRDYTRKAPAGYMIEASDIARVLTARDGGSTHTQTLDRVIEFLDSLGKDEVEVVKRRGERRVVFSEALVERLDEARGRTITPCVTGVPAEA